MQGNTKKDLELDDQIDRMINEGLAGGQVMNEMDQQKLEQKEYVEGLPHKNAEDV